MKIAANLGEKETAKGRWQGGHSRYDCKLLLVCTQRNTKLHVCGDWRFQGFRSENLHISAMVPLAADEIVGNAILRRAKNKTAASPEMEVHRINCSIMWFAKGESPRGNNLLLCRRLPRECFILMRDVNEMKIDIEFCPVPSWIASRTMHYGVGHGERRNPRWRHLGKFYVRSQPRTEACQVREQSYHEIASSESTILVSQWNPAFIIEFVHRYSGFLLSSYHTSIEMSNTHFIITANSVIEISHFPVFSHNFILVYFYFLFFHFTKNGWIHFH